jgi:membrane protein required for colicin V production
MTWIDIVLLVLIVLLVVHGMIMGLIRGLFDIAGIVIGYVLAINFCARLGLPQAVSFLIIFAATIIIVSAAGIILTKLIRHTPLSAVNRLLGALLGLAKAFVIGFVFLVILAFFHKGSDEFPRSDIAPVIQKYGLAASQALPVKWYRFIKNILEPEPPETKMRSAGWNEDFVLEGSTSCWNGVLRTGRKRCRA